MHIRIYWNPACCFLKRFPPTQTKFILRCQSKTAVAQMLFASELPLSPGNLIINSQKMIIWANPG